MFGIDDCFATTGFTVEDRYLPPPT